MKKFVFTAHIVLSVGWLGAVVAYLALAIAGLTTEDSQSARFAYPSMELIGWVVIVPLSLAALASGLIQALTTPWGVFRHFWVVAKLALTLVATAILLFHMPNVTRMSAAATAKAAMTVSDYRPERIQLVVHAGGGLLVLLVITVLSVFKPWGRTPYGRRKQQERASVAEGGGGSPRA